MKLVYCIMAALMVSFAATAQVDVKKEEKDGKKKKTKSISISNQGISVDATDSTDYDYVYVGKDSTKKKIKKEKAFDFTYAAIDLGINTLQDKTDYTSAATRNFLNVPDGMKNEQLFSLRTGKSWNVNVWPVMFKARLVKTGGQKLYLSSGIGLQMYNFRFTKDISYLNNTTPEVYLDSVDFSKNKLGFTYLAIPLALTAKTKIAKGTWIVYGAGVTGGYRISSWTKQVSGLRGKEKNHDAFNFNDFNVCVTGEIGVSGVFRIYASYQLTDLHETALNQRPISIGLRFGGV